MEKIIFFGLAIPILAYVLYLGGTAIMKGFSAKEANRVQKEEDESQTNLETNDQSINLSEELSNLNGKPMTQLLLKENCTVTITHSKTKDLKAECLEADIIVAAVGIPELVKGDWVKKDAIVIDVGINKTDKGIVGDVDFEDVSKNAKALTPVPGGVGPMTIACLLKNTIDCFKRSQI